MMEEGDWLICWERLRDGQPRYEYFGSREDAEAQIADWQIGYPWKAHSGRHRQDAPRDRALDATSLGRTEAPTAKNRSPLRVTRRGRIK